jgi:hypothetical protein
MPATSALNNVSRMSPSTWGFPSKVAAKRLRSKDFTNVQLASVALGAQNVKMTWLRIQKR